MYKKYPMQRHQNVCKLCHGTLKTLTLNCFKSVFLFQSRGIYKTCFGILVPNGTNRWRWALIATRRYFTSYLPWDSDSIGRNREHAKMREMVNV